MKNIKKLTMVLMTGAILACLGACSDMSRQGRDTAVGAGVGGVAGAVLTGGSAIGTVGGAAVGGVIGHEAGKPSN